MFILFYAILAFGILIFFHEFGHFLIAKASGVKVLKLALGFGPRILGKRIGETEYTLCAFPIGGYVKLLGEDPDEAIDESELDRSFSTKSVFHRMGIVIAGPAFNVFLAIVIVWFILIGEVPYRSTESDEVIKDYPAHLAGLKQGDRIVSINGKEVYRWRDMARIIATSEGKALDVEFLRGDRRLATVIHPRAEMVSTKFGDEIEIYRIGITSTQKVFTEKFGPWKSLVESTEWAWEKITLTITGLIKLVQGKISLKTLGSPILIGKMAGDQAKLGASNYFFFIAFISIILAIMNLLPIPILDGGHLFFFFIELVIGKPVDIKVRGVANYVGIILLGCIMALAIYNDINRFVPKNDKPKTEAPTPLEEKK
jgi:regulator of sigma E protease